MSETNTPSTGETDTSREDAQIAYRTPWALGLGGLVPFVVLAALLAYGGRETIAFDTVALAFSAYSATILAFLGGIRWGAALRPPFCEPHEFVLSILPSLAGWVLVLVPAPYAFAGFALCFAAQGIWDVVSARRGKLPDWFSKLRIVLTIVVAICEIAVFVRTF